MGQGESTDHAAHLAEPTAAHTAPPAELAASEDRAALVAPGNGSGELVSVDFGALGPDVPPAA